MGWLYQNEDIRNRSRKEIVIDHLKYDNPPRSCKVLYAVERGATVYAAVRCRNEDTGMNEVVGIVVLTHIASRDYCNFGTKIIEESMGPYQCDAPKKLINMLSSTDDESALRWRSNCLKNAHRHSAAATLRALEFGTVLELTDGSGKRLVVYRYRGRKIFLFTDRWMRMPASRIVRAGYRITSHPDETAKEDSQ